MMCILLDLIHIIYSLFQKLNHIVSDVFPLYFMKIFFT